MAHHCARVGARYREGWQRIVIAFDCPQTEGDQDNIVLDSSGQNRIDKNLPVACRIAKPRSQIDHISVRGVIGPSFITDGSDDRWSHCNADTEADLVAASAPA